MPLAAFMTSCPTMPPKKAQSGATSPREPDARLEITRLTQHMLVQIWQQHKQIDARTDDEDLLDDLTTPILLLSCY